MEEMAPSLRLVVSAEAARSGRLRVMHPCRCDAPDPEEARMEPIDVPVRLLLSEGRAIVGCVECEYRVLVVLAPEE